MIALRIRQRSESDMIFLEECGSAGCSFGLTSEHDPAIGILVGAAYRSGIAAVITAAATKSTRLWVLAGACCVVRALVFVANTAAAPAVFPAQSAHFVSGTAIIMTAAGATR